MRVLCGAWMRAWNPVDHESPVIERDGRAALGCHQTFSGSLPDCFSSRFSSDLICWLDSSSKRISHPRSSSFWLSFDCKQLLDVGHGLIAVNRDGEPLAIMIGRRARVLIADTGTQLVQNSLDLFPLLSTEHDLDHEPVPFGDQRAERF